MARLSRKRWEVGDVRMWNRPIEDIPVGWQLCDGTNGTPKLTNRALVGAGDWYYHNQQFGKDYPDVPVDVDSHTPSSAENAAHVHSGGVRRANTSDGQEYTYFGGSTSGSTVRNVNTNSSGSSAAHSHSAQVSLDTRQYSTAVIWIMRII